MDNSGKKFVVQSVRRALDILDFLAADSVTGKGAPLNAVAKNIGVAATTAHNILKTMVACGYVAQTPDRHYLLGPKWHGLGRSTGLGRIEAQATAVIRELAEKTGESTVLTTLVNGRRFAMLTATGAQIVRVAPSVEENGRFWDLVTCRTLAAHVPAPELDLIVEIYGWPGALWSGLNSRETLDAALASIRAQGVSTKSTPEVAAVAVPILGPDRRILAALGAYLPAFRATESRLSEIHSELTAAAARIAAEL